MTREILFRGKWTRNGKWIEGFYARIHDGKGNVSHRIYSGYAESDCGDFYPENFEVDPSTVGQFTGLCDKNGKKIFEGDIVEVTDDFGEISSSDCGYGKVIFLDGMWYIDGDVNNGLFNLNNVYYIKVIGNKRDNPELLEGGG